MRQFGLGANRSKRDHSSDHENYRQHNKHSHVPKKRHTEQQRVKVEQLFEVPVEIFKRPITHPTDSYQEFMASIRPVTITRATYELRDEHNRPFINFHGDLLYFGNPKDAFYVKTKLQECFSIQSTVVYGPANRRCAPGDVVPEPVVKVIKSK